MSRTSLPRLPPILKATCRGATQQPRMRNVRHTTSLRRRLRHRLTLRLVVPPWLSQHLCPMDPGVKLPHPSLTPSEATASSDQQRMPSFPAFAARNMPPRPAHRYPCHLRPTLRPPPAHSARSSPVLVWMRMCRTLRRKSVNNVFGPSCATLLLYAATVLCRLCPRTR